MPSALAVLRLTISSNLVGSCTGNRAGFQALGCPCARQRTPPPPLDLRSMRFRGPEGARSRDTRTSGGSVSKNRLCDGEKKSPCGLARLLHGSHNPRPMIPYAARYEAEAIQIAEQTQHAFTIGWAYLAASRPQLLKGEWQKARSLVELWIAGIRTGNVAIHLPWALAFSAWTLTQLGETSESLKRVQESKQLLDHQAGRGTIAHHGWAYHAAGRACLLLGRLEEAQGLGERALATSQHQPGFAAHALHLLGDVATHLDRFDAECAKIHYEKALTLAERRGMRPLVAHCHLGLGKLYRRSGNLALARGNLTVATSMYRDMAMGFWLKQGNTALNDS